MTTRNKHSPLSVRSIMAGSASWLVVGVLLFAMVNLFLVPKAKAATSGEMTMYFHKENSDLNEAYNYMGPSLPEPAADTVSSLTSTTNVNATPPTSFCESSNNTADKFNQVGASVSSTGNRCIATFISSPVGQAISMATTDTASITGQFWSSESTTAITTALNIYIYRWTSGTTVVSGDRIATLTCGDPGTSATSCTPTAVAPANNITFAASDRIIAIMSLNSTAGATSGRTVSAYFDSSARAASKITMNYTVLGNASSNKPALSGAMDDDFTIDTANTACTSGGVTYNTKWTCLHGTASNTAGAYNVGGTSGTINGDNSSWVNIKNQATSTAATVSNFGTTPSNTYMYQTLTGGYGNGNVTTIVNSSIFYDIGTTPTNPATPYNHSGLVLWASNTDYLELQLYSDGAINDTGTNTVKVALNTNGTLSGATSLNAATTGNSFNNIWLRFTNTGGSYQAQYSTDGTSFTNVGSAAAHDAFLRVGMNVFTAMKNPVSTYSASFEWFESTLAAATYNQDAYMWSTYADSTTPGSALAANNTVYTLTATEQRFRLRLMLQITGQSNISSPTSFKLQYVDKGAGTCAAPSGGVPSSYTDITSSTSIAYYDSPTPADGANISASVGNDPTGGGTSIVQVYKESNNFSASRTNLNNTNDGLWDFSLVDNTATPGATFCFRVVTSGGSTINTYTNYPTITTASFTNPHTADLLRGGTYFDSSGAKQRQYWSN